MPDSEVVLNPNMKTDPYASDDLDEDTEPCSHDEIKPVPLHAPVLEFNPHQEELQDHIQPPFEEDCTTKTASGPDINSTNGESIESELPQPTTALRRSERVKKKPAYLKDFVS